VADTDKLCSLLLFGINYKLNSFIVGHQRSHILARSKHSSLFGRRVNDEEEKYDWLQVTRNVVEAFNRHFCPEIFIKEAVKNGKVVQVESNQKWFALSHERLDYLSSHKWVEFLRKQQWKQATRISFFKSCENSLLASWPMSKWLGINTPSHLNLVLMFIFWTEFNEIFIH